MAAVGLVTGILATAGSSLLVVVDGVPYFAGLLGHETYATNFEDSTTVQWTRACATIMLLPDVAVGGVRSLTEIGKLNAEAHEAEALSQTAGDAALAARKRAAAIHNAERHPGPFNRHIHRANVLKAAATNHARLAEEAMNKIRTVRYRDIAAFQGATLAGTALFTAAPRGARKQPTAGGGRNLSQIPCSVTRLANRYPVGNAHE